MEEQIRSELIGLVHRWDERLSKYAKEAEAHADTNQALVLASISLAIALCRNELLDALAVAGDRGE